MIISSTNETERLRAQREVVTIARSIMTGVLGIVEGARRLSGLGHALGEERDADFTFFIVVDSETDHLPVGEVRIHWAGDALRQKEEELRTFETSCRDDAFRVCQNLIQRYDKPVA